VLWGARSTHTGILLCSCEGVPPLNAARVSPVGCPAGAFSAGGVHPPLYRVRARAMDCSRVRPFLSSSPLWPHSLRSLVLRGPHLRSPRSLGWRVLSCALAFFAAGGVPAFFTLTTSWDTRPPVTLLRSAPALTLRASLRSLLGITPLAQSVQRSFITSFLLIVIH